MRITIDRGIFSKIRTTAPIQIENGKMYVKPKGYQKMQIEPSTNINNLFSKDYYKQVEVK